MSDDWRDETKLVRGGLRRSEFAETAEGLFLTSGYVYDSPEQAEAAFKGEVERFIYSRYANPTVATFEQRVAGLDGYAHCRATASGMAAIWNALISHVKAGDRVVASQALFGSCQVILNEILPRYGVETEMVDGRDLDAWDRVFEKPAACALIETPSNPSLQIIDLEAVCERAHAAGAKVIVDNVFATPVLQKPKAYGADVVVYSATKHMDGQGRVLGGAILSDDEDWITGDLQTFLRHTGPAISPFNAWVLLKGLETLPLRVHAACDRALILAERLEAHPKVARCGYPGLWSHPQHMLAMRQMSEKGGTVVMIDLKGGQEAAFAFMNRLQLIDVSNNLGDSKSLATHPRTTTHRRLSEEARRAQGIVPGSVRISVGLEHVDDLWTDLERALDG